MRYSIHYIAQPDFLRECQLLGSRGDGHASEVVNGWTSGIVPGPISIENLLEIFAYAAKAPDKLRLYHVNGQEINPVKVCGEELKSLYPDIPSDVVEAIFNQFHEERVFPLKQPTGLFSFMGQKA